MEQREEMLSRLEQMAAGNDKWDLSDNDRAAIRMAVNEVRAIEARPAKTAPTDGNPAPQKPSIGRIVIYHHAPCNECVSEAHDCPAIVTMVYSDGTLGLFVFSPLCDDGHRAFVAFGTGDGQWSWPERV